MGIIVVVVIGLIAGLILSVASIVFAVPVNEKEEALVGVSGRPGCCSRMCRNLRCFCRFYGEKSCNYPVCRYM